MQTQGVKPSRATDFKALPGRGAYAKIGDDEVYVGGPSLLKELNLNAQKSKLSHLESQGNTVVFTVINGKVAGVFAFQTKSVLNLKKQQKSLKQASRFTC